MRNEGRAPKDFDPGIAFVQSACSFCCRSGDVNRHGRFQRGRYTRLRTGPSRIVQDRTPTACSRSPSSAPAPQMVSMIGCDCPVCTSTDPRDFRNRTSAYLVWDGLHLLIDTSTELRLQALAYGLKRVDAVLFLMPMPIIPVVSMSCADSMSWRKRTCPSMPDPDTAAILRERFAYAFEDVFPFYENSSNMTLHEVRGPFEIAGKTMVPIPVIHGRTNVLGYRFGPLAYVTDAKIVPESSIELLKGVEYPHHQRAREREHPRRLGCRKALSRCIERNRCNRTADSSLPRNQSRRRLGVAAFQRRSRLRRSYHYRRLIVVPAAAEGPHVARAPCSASGAIQNTGVSQHTGPIVRIVMNISRRVLNPRPRIHRPR